MTHAPRNFALVTALGIVLSSASPVAAQNIVKPYFQIIVDTSGSMGNCGNCGTVANTCGQPSTKMNAAKCVLQDLVNSYGDAVFGLTEFDMGCFFNPPQDIYATTCPQNSGAASISPDTARTLVALGEDNQTALLSYVDFAPTYADTEAQGCPGTDTPNEILTNNTAPQSFGWGVTPLAGSMYSVQRYYQGNDPTFPGSPIAADPFVGCRPYYVILLTDGVETCAAGNAAQNRAAARAAAAALRSTTVSGVGTFDIKTFVIGFGIAPGATETEEIANSGGTDAPGPNQAFYAQSQDQLSLAFSQIIQSSLLTEVCGGGDEDCDGATDEGFVKYCDVSMGINTATLCTNPGDPCGGGDNNCIAGTSDEITNACGGCGATPTEICNVLDDDCDGFIDENNVCAGCTPEAEICDGKDNDCDNKFDEGAITRSCGSSVGLCSPGMQTCVEQVTQQPSGTWTVCNDTGPQPEICDGLDNDCDGLDDGFAQECYTFMDGCTGNPSIGYTCNGICQNGSEICTGGAFGTCSGEIGPATEICNGVDDNCNGMIDEGNPGGGVPCGTSCGMGVTECVGGTLTCTGGGMGSMETCNGFDDDCDGMTDEGVGNMGPCTEGGTLCSPGQLECVNGAWTCVGGVPPEVEQCDCVDNNCNGMTDEGSLCGAGATCLSGPYCGCARPCASGEFPCPAGLKCVDPAMDGNRFCVPDPCAGVVCDPNGNSGPASICVEGTCTPICDTITCPGMLVCRAADGACVPDNCVGFPDRCIVGELCIDGACVTDPCAGVTCTDADQFCRDGNCVGSCAGVTCPDGEQCDGGNCVPDPCASVSCTSFQTCDPATGMCENELCSGVSCATGQICNPLTGNCDTDPCIGITCPAGQVCDKGNCWNPGDINRPDAGPPVTNEFVTPGGGGCRSGPAGGVPLALLLGLVGFLIVGRRRRAGR